MIDKINSNFSVGRTVYANQTRRQAWRDEMLSQVLAKVREAAPAVDQPRLTASSGPPPKGSLLNRYV